MLLLSAEEHSIIGMYHHVDLEMILLFPLWGLFWFLFHVLQLQISIFLVYQNFKGLIWEVFALEKMSFALDSARVCCIRKHFIYFLQSLA